MKTLVIHGIGVVAILVSLFAGWQSASAGGGGTPLPQPIPAQLYIPPNCEVVHVEGKGGLSFSYLECHLPPECEVVSVDLGGGLGLSYIECDLEPGCSLESGEWNGHTYWYIHCDEPECIGGCNPLTPPGIGLKNPPERPGDPVTPPPPPLPLKDGGSR